MSGERDGGYLARGMDYFWWEELRMSGKRTEGCLERGMEDFWQEE